MPDGSIQRTESFVVILLIVAYVLLYVIGRLRRTRPGFDIRTPAVAGVTLRVLAVVALNSVSVQSQLRGGDESTFLDYARAIAASPWGRGNLPHGRYQLQTDVFAAQIKLLPVTNTALRVTQIGIAMLGIILIAAAVHDLAGPRAARLMAWLVALEPANIFFNGALHKEPLMVLASGLVVFGGTKIWQRLAPGGIALSALGGLIAVETRSYAGWFLVSATVFLILVAGLRHLKGSLRGLPAVYAVALALFLLTPTLLSVTSNKSLQTLQVSQNANTSQSTGNSGAPNGNNLALEQVNFSTRGAVITSLPRRMADLTFRPYPWQLHDISQQLGAVGTLIWIGGLILLVRFAWAVRRRGLAMLPPILFPFLFLLIAYSLSAGNAGTGFRYRTHLVLLGAAMLAVLREQVLRGRETSREPISAPPAATHYPSDSAPVPA